MLSNYHSCTCEAPQTEEVAYSQPNIYYRDGYGWTSNEGCNIDSDSLMRNGQVLTQTKCRQNLQTREHLSTPYMGRGLGDSCIEGNILAGEDTSQKRQCNTLAGISIDNLNLDSRPSDLRPEKYYEITELFEKR